MGLNLPELRDNIILMVDQKHKLLIKRQAILLGFGSGIILGISWRGNSILDIILLVLALASFIFSIVTLVQLRSYENPSDVNSDQKSPEEDVQNLE